MFWLHSDAAVSVATAFFLQATLIVSGLLVARLLGVENRGHFALLALIPVVLTQVGTLGLPAATTYFIARQGQSAGVLRSVVPGMAVLGLCLLLLHTAILVVLFDGESTAVRLAGFATLITVPGMIAQMLGLAVLQGEQRFYAFSALRILQVVTFSLSVALLFMLDGSDLALVAITWASTVMLSGAVVILVATRRMARSPAREEPLLGRREILRFGLKSLPGSISLVDTFRVDQIVVGVIAGPAALGLYVVAKAFTNLPRYVAQSIGMVAYPRVAAADSPARLVLAYVLLATVACSSIVIALEVAAARLVPFFYGGAFAEAAAITRVLLISALLLSLIRVLNDCARGLGHPEWGVSAEAASVVALLPALVLGAAAGPTGVAWALVAGYGAGVAVLVLLILTGIRTAGRQVATASSEVFP